MLYCNYFAFVLRTQKKCSYCCHLKKKIICVLFRKSFLLKSPFVLSLQINQKSQYQCYIRPYKFIEKSSHKINGVKGFIIEDDVINCTYIIKKKQFNDRYFIKRPANMKLDQCSQFLFQFSYLAFSSLFYICFVTKYCKVM